MKRALIKLLADKTGQNVTVAHGADWLRNDIESQTGSKISIQTIKRLTGVLSSHTDEGLHINSITKEILAKYIGFDYWVDLEEHLKAEARKNSVKLYVDATLSFGAERVELLLKAADAGSITAMADLADCYLNGIDVEMDESVAIEWLHKAANLGHMLSAAHLGELYINGKGDLVKKDQTKAEKYLTIAAEQGFLEAQLLLCVLYFESQEYKNCIFWARIAAVEGDNVAYWALGRCFLDGLGVNKNVSEGLKWMEMAAETGDADAQVRMALEYFKGEIVERNVNKMFDYLQRAASQGHTTGMTMLAKCYIDGWGTQQDKPKGMKLMRDAAEAGDENAISYLESYGHD